MLAVVKQSFCAFGGLDCDALKKDKAFMLDAVKQDYRVLLWASKDLKADRAFILDAKRENGYALHYASEFQNDIDVVKEAVKQKGCALQFASYNHFEFFSEEHVERGLRGNRQVVLAAVKQDWRAIKYASNTLKDDRAIILPAVAQHYAALVHASERLSEGGLAVYSRGIVAYAHARKQLINANTKISAKTSVFNMSVLVDMILTYACEEVEMTEQTVLEAKQALKNMAEEKVFIRNRALESYRIRMLIPGNSSTVVTSSRLSHNVTRPSAKSDEHDGVLAKLPNQSSGI